MFPFTIYAATQLKFTYVIHTISKIYISRASVYSGCVLKFSGNPEMARMSNFKAIRWVTSPISWWRHPMKTFSASMTLCGGNPPVTGGFPSQRPVTRRFDVFFDVRLNKPLSKRSRRRWFETPWLSLWRHCNVVLMLSRAFQPITAQLTNGSCAAFVYNTLKCSRDGNSTGIKTQNISTWFSLTRRVSLALIDELFKDI